MKTYVIKAPALLGVAVFFACASTSKTADRNLGALQGLWQAVAITEAGQPLDSDMVSPVMATIAGDRYVLAISDVVTEMRARVNPDAEPKQIDLMPVAGANTGVWFPGIYQAKDDELVIAYAPAGAVRPTAFDGSQGRLIRWQRVSTKTQPFSAEIVTNSLGMKFRRILPTTFVMGAEFDEPARQDETQHRVTLTKPFYLAAHEVTVGQFAQFVRERQSEEPSWSTDAERGTLGRTGGLSTVTDGVNKWDKKASWRNPGFSQTHDHPVVFVSWRDAVEFTKWLSKKDGRTYRLPTEAEWEYACRAGSRSAYWWGNDPGEAKGRANVADKTYAQRFAHRDFQSGFSDGHVFTSPVGTWKPNPLGLYDMHGNVFEWVHDVWALPQRVTSVDPAGPSTGSTRVAKGGAWGSRPDRIRAAFRFREHPEMRFAGVGFRVLLEVE